MAQKSLFDCGIAKSQKRALDSEISTNAKRSKICVTASQKDTESPVSTPTKSKQNLSEIASEKGTSSPVSTLKITCKQCRYR